MMPLSLSFTSFNDCKMYTMSKYNAMGFGINSASLENMMFSEESDPGLLIAFEGMDGSGKTTQQKLLKTCLEGNGEDVIVSKWNSSPLFKDLIKAKKRARLLDPVLYAVLHAADFRHRLETVIRPSLREGKIVLADRYIFTGITRDEDPISSFTFRLLPNCWQNALSPTAKSSFMRPVRTSRGWKIRSRASCISPRK